MKKYEIMKPVMLLAEKGSIVMLSDEQAAAAKDFIKEYKKTGKQEEQGEL